MAKNENIQAQEVQAQHKEIANNFLNSLAKITKEKFTKAKDTSISNITMSYEPYEIGLNSENVDSIKVTYTREYINTYVGDLLGIEQAVFSDVVINGVTESGLFSAYNTAVKKLLKDNKPAFNIKGDK